MLIEFFKKFIPYYKDYIGKFFLVILGSVLTALGTAGSAYVIKPVLDEIFINIDY